MWLRHKEFSEFVRNSWDTGGRLRQKFMAKLEDCAQNLSGWNKSMFGRVQKRIAALKKELEYTKTEFRTEQVISKETQLQEELDEWFAREELMWRQRSRIEWLKEGDLNTKFFHTRASQRKKKNTITKIKGPNGIWITDDKEICEEAVSHFVNIFRSVHPRETAGWEEKMSFIHQSVSPEKVEFLCAPFTEADIQSAVFQIGSTKAPGPDGFPALFF
ncbi:hypothetical protein QQ045_019614 [Rhodiola kirilowii]